MPAKKAETRIVGKFPIPKPKTGQQVVEIEMPKYAQITSVGVIKGRSVLYALINTANAMHTVRFRVLETGQPVEPNGNLGQHVGRLDLDNGAYILHVFRL